MTRTLAYFCRVIDCGHRIVTGEGTMLCRLCDLEGTSPVEEYFEFQITPTGVAERFQELCPNKQVIKQTIAMENL